MYIKVEPAVYKAFFQKLLDKFIEIELKGDLTGYPNRDSRKIWEKWDSSNDKPRASVLFLPRNKNHISHEYFWRRNNDAENTSDEFKIIAESFTKAFHYIGYEFMKGSSEENVIKTAKLQYEHFKTSITEERKNNKEPDSNIDQVNQPVLKKKLNRSSIAEYQKYKDNGTFFVENDLPEIINALEPKRNLYQAIIFIDIDDLTIINKQFGHEVGDIVLEEFGRIIQEQNIFDYAGRCGDDTFYGVILYTNEPRTVESCNTLRQTLQNNSWNALADKLRVTCTLGMAILKKDENPYSWIQRSALGMVTGKEKGKNAVQLGPQFLSKNDLNASGVIETIEEEVNKPKSKKPRKPKRRSKEERERNRQNRMNASVFSLRTWFS